MGRLFGIMRPMITRSRPITILVLFLLLCGFLTDWSGVRAQQLPQFTEILLGYSGQGRPIMALRIGNGSRKLALIGGTHGLPEYNTTVLVEQLSAYFRANPQQVPASVRLYLVPNINPDGVVLGTRFNASTVDLNRNMNTNLDSCPENDWNITVQGARGLVSDTGGPYPDSEPESRIVRDFLLDASAVIFYHSNGGDVFPAFCEHDPSIALAQAYAQVSGYRYDRYWPNYNITGGMNDWAGSLGIAAIVPELFTGTEPDYDENLRAVQAILAQPEMLPMPETHTEAGFPVDALIWRYWKSHGGEELFGSPLEAPQHIGATVRQSFQNGVLELRADQADSAAFVQLLPLGRNVSVRQANITSDEAQPELLFEETGYGIRGAMVGFWQRNGGIQVFGYPISEAFERQNALGQQEQVQIFERSVLIMELGTETIRLEPLGWASLIKERASAATLAHQIR